MPIRWQKSDLNDHLWNLVAACDISVGVAMKAVMDRMNRDHKKHWKSVTGLEHTNGFLQGPCSKRTRELLEWNGNWGWWQNYLQDNPPIHVQVFIVVSFLQVFLPEPCMASSPTHATFPDLIILVTFGMEYKFWNSSLCNLLHPPIISSPLDQNILLSILLSNTLSMCSSLNVRD
jgi:hypothetical protein